MESTADRTAALNGSARGIASDDLRYSLRIAVWVRWFAGIAWLVQHNYRPDFDSGVYVPNMLLVLSLLVFNAYVHYRIRTNRALTWHWALALSAMDVIAVTAGLAISGGFNNGFFVLYYPAIATFAVVFASFRLSFVMGHDGRGPVRGVELLGRSDRRLRRQDGERCCSYGS